MAKNEHAWMAKQREKQIKKASEGGWERKMYLEERKRMTEFENAQKAVETDRHGRPVWEFKKRQWVKIKYMDKNKFEEFYGETSIYYIGS
jgi:hypothetical protein